MKFGLAFSNVGPFSKPSGALAIAAAAEQAGFDSIWTVEHVFVPKGYESEYPYDKSGRMPGSEDSPIPDPLIWLSYVASATTTIKLATGILIVPQRNPVVLAKECATLDSLSGGRLLLGVGAGWLEEEFDAIGVPFSERGRRLDEYVAAMRSLWSEGISAFKGSFVDFESGYSYPKPSQPSIPIVIGGHSPAAARRAGRLGDGFFPAGASGGDSTVPLTDLFKIMRDTAEKAGRDADAIELTTGGAAAFAPDPIEALSRLAEKGVSRVVIPPLSYDPAALGDALGQFGENVIAKMS